MRHHVSHRLLCLPLSLALLCAVNGCSWFPEKDKKSEPAAASQAAGAVNAKGQPIYVVTADFTPIYRLGPQQGGGPDQSLTKGTVVGLLKRSYGFSRVQLENGFDGYLATEDIAPAPPETLAALAPETTNTQGNSAIVEHYSVNGTNAADAAATSTSNAQALPDLPEPALDPESSQIVKPEFRY